MTNLVVIKFFLRYWGKGPSTKTFGFLNRLCLLIPVSNLLPPLINRQPWSFDPTLLFDTYISLSNSYLHYTYLYIYCLYTYTILIWYLYTILFFTALYFNKYIWSNRLFYFTRAMFPHHHIVCMIVLHSYLSRYHTQLLWLEMALFSKKALHNIEKHS